MTFLSDDLSLRLWLPKQDGVGRLKAVKLRLVKVSAS